MFPATYGVAGQHHLVFQRCLLQEGDALETAPTLRVLVDDRTSGVDGGHCGVDISLSDSESQLERHRRLYLFHCPFR